MMIASAHTKAAIPALRLALVLGAGLAWFGSAVLAETVDRSEPPRFMILEIAPSRVAVGETAELRWSVWNADEVKLSRDNRRSLPPSGSIRITPTRGGDRTYEIFAVNGAGLEATKRVTLEVAASAQSDPRDERPVSGPVEIRSLEAAPLRATGNEQVTIAWDTRNAQKVFFGTRVGKTKPARVEARGSERVRPARTTTYHLVALGSDGKRVERSVTVQVGAAPPPRILSFTPSSTRIAPGKSVTFRWTTQGAEKIILAGQTHADSGRASLRFSKTAVVDLVAVGSDGQTSERKVRIEVVPPKPTIAVFSFDRSVVVSPKSARLTWQVRNADSVQLALVGKASRTVRPQGSVKISGRRPGIRTYRLTAANRHGTTRKDVTIQVISQAEANCEKC